MKRQLMTIFYVITLLFAFANSQVTLSGVVKDAKSKKVIVNANISLSGTHIATVTNSDGTFSITIPEDDNKTLEISHIGYSNAIVGLKDNKSKLTVFLEPVAKTLAGIWVYSGDPRLIVKEAINKIPKNYPSTTDMLTLFYRETVQKGKRYTEVSEAIIDAYKHPYRFRSPGSDKVQVHKGRKVMSQKSSDTLAIKVVGGPSLALFLDFVKNEDFFLDISDLDYYDFKIENTTYFDDRPQFKIKFKPRVYPDYPLFAGILYVDVHTLSFTRAEIEMDMSNKQLVQESILRKKPRGLRFTPVSIKFVISYRQSEEGDIYLSYLLNEIKFKCDWKRRIFSSTYTATAEMVVVDRIPSTTEKIERRDAFDSRASFSDLADQYWDANYWEGYNIIEPSESLEKAVEHLRKVK